MKIAIDVSPLETGHKVRGVGFYLSHLKRSLEQYFPSNSYTYFTQTKNIPNDVELIHYPYFDPFFLTLPFLKKKKTVVTVHDLTPLVLPNLFPAGLKGKAKWVIQKKSLQHVDAIITDSEASKKDIARLAGITQSKIHVAYLAASESFKKLTDQKELKAVQKKYDLPNEFVLYVGDVTPNKNIVRLAKAAIQLDVPLVLVGKALINEDYDQQNPWNTDLKQVQELATDNKTIIRLGFVPDEDLVALYNLATVFCMPSLYEGFGLPVVEAMACGCPIVASDKGSLREVVGDAAKIIDPYSVNDIEKGLREVLKNSLLRKKMIKKGFERVKNFSWKKTAEETVRVYDAVCK